MPKIYFNYLVGDKMKTLKDVTPGETVTLVKYQLPCFVLPSSVRYSVD